MAKLLSGDPGMDTGFVIDDDGALSFWEIDSRDLTAVENFLIGVNPDVIIYEDFKLRPSLMKAELYSIQVIGVMRLYAARNNIPIPFTPIPSEAKAFWDDNKIKKIDLWRHQRGWNGHAMDALRVHLKYKMDTNAEWFARMLPLLKD
jgi:hypothetical protein